MALSNDLVSLQLLKEALPLVEKYAKNTVVKIGYGSFDHRVAVVKPLQFFFFILRLKFKERLGAFNIFLEKYIQDLSTGILYAPKFLNFQLLNQKKSQICIYLVSADQAGQKNYS